MPKQLKEMKQFIFFLFGGTVYLLQLTHYQLNYTKISRFLNLIISFSIYSFPECSIYVSVISQFYFLRAFLVPTAREIAMRRAAAARTAFSRAQYKNGTLLHEGSIFRQKAIFENYLETARAKFIHYITSQVQHFQWYFSGQSHDKFLHLQCSKLLESFNCGAQLFLESLQRPYCI
ncbi:hypothetical protein SS50377_24153 [Spironucleus salmonicida]|uniref:Uncharacterized protein n=1 Tax=Spironucleus salmonicida TaxID=348837 RepID=A0A9P8RZ17_9EUKA|nr:hypothetical protein SS50377_24153 [Spironucleus salmonicida]